MMTLDELKAMVDESLPWPRPRKMKVRGYRLDFDKEAYPDLPWHISGRGVSSYHGCLAAAFGHILELAPSVKYPDEIQCL